MEPVWVERSAGFIAKTGNAVLLCFRQMLAAHFLQPTGRLLSTLKIEQPRIQNLIDIDFAIRDRIYLRVCVEGFQNSRQTGYVARACQIGLAD